MFDENSVNFANNYCVAAFETWDFNCKENDNLLT